METEDQSSLQKFGKTLCIRDNITAAMMLKTQNGKCYATSLLPQSNKMHRLEYIMLKQPHICRTITENTSPVPQSRVFHCATGINQNRDSVTEVLSCEVKQLIIHPLQEQHMAACLAGGVSRYVVFDLWWKIMLVNTQRRHTLQLTRKVSNKKREKTLFLLQYPNAPDVGWRQSGKDSACSRIKAFHPLAFTNSLKTSMKVQLERVSHCIGSPTIIRHWKIAPMTTTLSCEAASRSRCVLLGIGPFSKEWL